MEKMTKSLKQSVDLIKRWEGKQCFLIHRNDKTIATALLPHGWEVHYFLQVANQFLEDLGDDTNIVVDFVEVHELKEYFKDQPEIAQAIADAIRQAYNPTNNQA